MKNRNRKFIYLFIAAFVVMAANILISAQQVPSSAKNAQIQQFRRLTGANTVNVGINLSIDDVRTTLLAVVEEDKEITELQKQDLKKSVAEAYSRIDKRAQEFFADRFLTTQVYEDVILQIYDKAFSEAELTELIAFYQTAVGQKAAAFLPTLSKQVQSAVSPVLGSKLETILRPLIQAETEQIKQKIVDVKGKKSNN